MLSKYRTTILKIRPTQNINSRLCHVANKENEIKQSPKVAQDVINYLESSPEYKNIITEIPKNLLKKYKTPESMYLINKNTAKNITNTLLGYINKGAPLVEVNPGFGFLTQELLQCQDNPIYLYEVSHNFTQFLSVSFVVIFS